MNKNHKKLHDILNTISDAYAPNTIRAYKADFEELIVFCNESKLSALPAKPTTIAKFVDEVTNKNISSASIRRKLVSIAAIHRWANFNDPTKSPEAKLAVRKMHRKLGRLCGQAEPINKDRLEAMLMAAKDDLRGQRDRTLLMLAYDTMRRRSELASLLISDIRKNNTGASILLSRSKTDQERLGTWLHITEPTYRQIQAWIIDANILNGKILRGIKGNKKITNGLNGAQIGRIFKRLASTAGIDQETVAQISGHSIRVGAAQDLLLAGASLPQIMAKGGWTKVDTVMRYIEKFGSNYN
jgi:site-specific recombinase XerD